MSVVIPATGAVIETVPGVNGTDVRQVVYAFGTGDLVETAPGSDTASSGLNGRLQRVAQNLTVSNGFFGALTETAPVTDTASSGLNGRLQRVAQNLTISNGALGSLTETAPATDTASSGVNGRLQRVAQNLTVSNGFFGSLTETAPATDTASSGLNGRLQRIAQRLTTLITNGVTATSVTGAGATVEMVPTVTAGAYPALTAMGGIITFANILPATTFNGVIQSLTLKFKNTLQTTPFDVAIFTASPAGTFTDHNSPAIATADTALLTGIYQMQQNQSPLGTHTIYNLDGIGKQVNGSSTSLFAVLITRAIPVPPVSTTEMSLRIGVVW
jgi:hypothetical protein